MRTHVRTAVRRAVVAAAIAATWANGFVRAQDKQVAWSAAQPAPKPLEVALQVQIVIARYQGEKRTSSMPYTLSLMSGQGRANLRLGAEMPVSTTTLTPAGGDAKADAPAQLTSFTTRNVGTIIDVRMLQASSVADNRYVLEVSVSENWFQPADAVAAGVKNAPPIARNYQSQNTVQVKDGETAQFTAATDRTTGEVIRIEVTAKVLK